MFKVIKKSKDTITLEVDIQTYEWLQSEVSEKISDYEFQFETPTLAKDLL